MNLDKTYIDFIKQLKQKILIAKNRATLSVNRAMIELYFDIGRDIVAKQESLGWGKSVVEQMARDLQSEFGKRSGYSTQNLWYMRQFYNTYRDKSNLQQLVGEIPWGHNILIFSKCKERDEQEYYIETTIKQGWTRDLLHHHIKTKLFQRDRIEPKQHNFAETLPSNLSVLADDMIKKKLNALVAIELKVGKFRPEYAGKMNFYLNILNDRVKIPHENPAIGIILCTDKTGVEVEYALQNIHQPMGVSTYNVKESLPQELAKKLEIEGL